MWSDSARMPASPAMANEVAHIGIEARQSAW